MEGFDCIVPAAGESRRMGQWKLLLPYEGRTVVEWSVEHALHFCSRVILVVGHRGTELSELFSRNGLVQIVENPDYGRGMFSSIRRGAEELRTARFFVALADMPLLPPSIFARLASLPGPLERGGAARPFFRGMKGHPVLLPSSAKAKLLDLDLDGSMRDVLHGVPMHRLESDDPAVLADIDTPQDYRRLLESG